MRHHVAPRLRTAVLLCAILALGALVRLYDISSVPTELIVDEIDLYNSAHSIATTGHDIDGNLSPFLYSPFARNPPMYAAAAYASSLVFGRTPFGLRLPAVLFGLIAIGLVYGIALELTRRRSVAFVAAMLQATQPIFIHFSRVAWEPASELPFLLGGLYLLICTFDVANRSSKNTGEVSLWGLLGAGLLLGLTSYTYMAGWFYAAALGVPIFIAIAWRYRGWRSWVKIAGALAIWFVVSWPAVWVWFFDPLSASKVERVSTFAHGFSVQAMFTFCANYLTHFRWSYLVTTGDPQPATTWRYLNGFGAFFGWVIPLCAVGLICGLRNVPSKWARAWIVIWLLAYPLGGALTNEGAPNAPRTLAGAPVFCILAALGFRSALLYFTSKEPYRSARGYVIAARTVLIGGVVLSLYFFAHFYFTRYVHQNSNAWDSGTRAMFASIRALQGRYDRVCFSVRPSYYEIDSYERFYLDGVPIRRIDDITPPACFLRGTLLVTDTDHPVSRKGFRGITEIRDVDGNPFAFISGNRSGGALSTNR